MNSKENFINNLIQEYFLHKERGENTTEILLCPGEKMLYIQNGENQSHHFRDGMTIESEDLEDYQLSIIKKKTGDDEEENDKISNMLSKQGDFNYSFVVENITFRVNWSMGDGVNNSYMRIRKLPNELPIPEELFIPNSIIEEFYSHRGGGLIIVSAPPGNGKSTLIASVLQKIANEQILNIITLEDPIEYKYDNKHSFIEQREMFFDFDTYDSGIKACLKQKPNIVVVQEINSLDMIKEVMCLLEKGIMVVSTFHTHDTTSIFSSIFDAYPISEKGIIADKLKNYFKCFVSQRLIPRADKTGVMPVFEILKNIPVIRGHIGAMNTSEIANALEYEGQLSFAEDIANKIKGGVISEEKGLEYCPHTRKDDLIELLGIEE